MILEGKEAIGSYSDCPHCLYSHLHYLCDGATEEGECGLQSLRKKRAPSSSPARNGADRPSRLVPWTHRRRFGPSRFVPGFRVPDSEHCSFLPIPVGLTAIAGFADLTAFVPALRVRATAIARLADLIVGLVDLTVGTALRVRAAATD